MLKLYYNPLSPNARRVWLTMLEKQIPFEPMIVNLDGDQLEPEFLAVNPFHHIPVIVDDGVRLVESLAILDYLEAKYPTPALLPSDPVDLAIVRMVQMVVTNELFPVLVPLIVSGDGTSALENLKLVTVLDFLEEQLGDRLYFGSDRLTLADIVAGTAMVYFPLLGVKLLGFPKLQGWLDRMMARPVWQQARLSQENWEQFRRRVKVLVRLRQRELRRMGAEA